MKCNQHSKRRMLPYLTIYIHALFPGMSNERVNSNRDSAHFPMNNYGKLQYIEELGHYYLFDVICWMESFLAFTFRYRVRPICVFRFRVDTEHKSNKRYQIFISLSMWVWVWLVCNRYDICSDLCEFNSHPIIVLRRIENKEIDWIYDMFSVYILFFFLFSHSAHNCVIHLFIVGYWVKYTHIYRWHLCTENSIESRWINK